VTTSSRDVVEELAHAVAEHLRRGIREGEIVLDAVDRAGERVVTGGFQGVQEVVADRARGDDAMVVVDAVFDVQARRRSAIAAGS
jgi:hypothetical protein